MVERGTVDVCEPPSSRLERPLLAPWCLPHLCALRRVGLSRAFPTFIMKNKTEEREAEVEGRGRRAGEDLQGRSMGAGRWGES